MIIDDETDNVVEDHAQTTEHAEHTFEYFNMHEYRVCLSNNFSIIRITMVSKINSE
jgi:hypothetical protein